jgi:hypothetical protein
MSLLNKTFTTSSQVQWTETDGEVILADLNSETIFGMDEVALTVWNGVVQGKPVSEVVGLVAADVEKFVQQMIDKGWLHEQAPAAHA